MITRHLNVQWLVAEFGHRWVPVELGRWPTVTEDIITISEFVNKFLLWNSYSSDCHQNNARTENSSGSPIDSCGGTDDNVHNNNTSSDIDIWSRKQQSLNNAMDSGLAGADNTTLPSDTSTDSPAATSSIKVAYIAQHALFEQFPILRTHVTTPPLLTALFIKVYRMI